MYTRTHCKINDFSLNKRLKKTTNIMKNFFSSLTFIQHRVRIKIRRVFEHLKLNPKIAEQ